MVRGSENKVIFFILSAFIFFVAGWFYTCILFAQPNNRPNLIFLTVDTLRADRLSAYGYHRRTSPALDSLMREGVRFSNATTVIPLTNPSFTTVMTSHYPQETGATRNGLPMNADFLTLAQVLKNHGYQTGAVISNWTLKKDICALSAGFDYYDENFKSKRSLVLSEQDAKDVTDIALAWFDKINRQTPFFAWIHYSDPHAPYEFRKQFKFPFKNGENKETPSYRYDTEVAYTDYHIGRLLRGLESKGLRKNTYIFFFADHGESLGEHSYFGHGRQIYQPSMRVPLAIVGPAVRHGIVSDSAVSLLDIMPTALAILGIDPPSGVKGRNLLSVEGSPAQLPTLPLFFMTYRGVVPDVAGAKKIMPGIKPLKLGMRDGDIKLIYSPETDKRELYNLLEDPLELTDLSEKRREKTAVMTRLTWEWFHKTLSPNAQKVRIIPPDVRKKLESLGYVY